MEVTEEGLAGFFKVVLPLLDGVSVGWWPRRWCPPGPWRSGSGSRGRRHEPNTLITGAKELAGGAGPSAGASPGAGRNKAADSTQGCWGRWTRWSSRDRGATRVAVAVDVQVDPINWPPSWAGRATRRWRGWWPELDYSAPAGQRQVSEGAQHPDRDGQFRYLNHTPASTSPTDSR